MTQLYTVYLDWNAEDDLGEEKVPRLRFSVVVAVLALAPALTLGGLLGDFLALVSSFCFSLLREDSVVGICSKRNNFRSDCLGAIHL